MKLRLPALASLLGLICCSCSPFYVMRAAYEESRILLARKDIEKVLNDPATSAVEREKLELVPQARAFAEKIGLAPGSSYTSYARVNRDVLAWVFMAARPYAFELYQWWFPIVGSLPYKGYFDKSDAEQAGGTYKARGYETFVRPTDAFSTLGWFDDPMLSTTLRHDSPRIVEIVLHESFHRTVWISGAVDFNESMANFVGTRASVDFFEDKLSQCQDATCREKAQGLLNSARGALASEIRLEGLINALYNDLNTLYLSQVPDELKAVRRKEIFEQHISPIRMKNPNLQILKEINNAEIMQLKVYLTGFSDIERLFEAGDSKWATFLEEARALSENVKNGHAADPWSALKTRLENIKK